MIEVVQVNYSKMYALYTNILILTAPAYIMASV